jgi:hypothetical protein
MGTYKLLKVIAYTAFAIGGLAAVTALYTGSHDGDGTAALIIFLSGVVGGTVVGGLFLFFAKLLEQNEEIIDRLSNATK